MLFYITLSIWSLCQYNMRSCESVHPLLAYLLKKNNHLILYLLFTKPHQRLIAKNWKPKGVIPCSINPSSWRLLETPQTGFPLSAPSYMKAPTTTPLKSHLPGFCLGLLHFLASWLGSSECEGQFLVLELLNVRNISSIRTTWEFVRNRGAAWKSVF